MASATFNPLPKWCSKAVVFDLPMTVKFRGLERRQGMLLQGEAGWAEWSPFADYADDEAAVWLQACQEAATFPEPKLRREFVEVNCTIPAVTPEKAMELAHNSKCRTAKVKVAQRGQNLHDDLARVEAVRAALGPTGLIRIDANGAWDGDQAFKAIKELSAFDLQYAEQPCATVTELAALRIKLARSGIDCLIAADESIRRADDPLLVKRAAAADIAIIKLQPLGGIARVLQLVFDLELPVVVSSALESSIGLRSGVVLAAALPKLPYACGLNTAPLLGADVVSTPVQANAGHITVVPRLHPDTVGCHLASTEVTTWWLDRLYRVSRKFQP